MFISGAIAVALLAYVCLFTFRVLGSIVILGKACDLIEDHKQKQQQKKKQSVEEAREHHSGGPRAKDSSAALKTEGGVTNSQRQREEACGTPLLAHRRTLEPVSEPKRVQTPAEDDDCSELFQLPDRSSDRLFLFQNSCDDKADVLLTNMNVALLDSPDSERGRDTTPALEASSEGDMSDRDNQRAAYNSLQRTSRQRSPSRPGSGQETFPESLDNQLAGHFHEKQGRNVNTAAKDNPVDHGEQGKADRRKVCEMLFPVEAGLSPASKAKSLSSPDLIRSEADFEEWDSEREDMDKEEEEERITFSPEGVASLESFRKRGLAQRPT